MSSLVLVIAYHRTGTKRLPEPMMTEFTDTCVLPCLDVLTFDYLIHLGIYLSLAWVEFTIYLNHMGLQNIFHYDYEIN